MSVSAICLILHLLSNGLTVSAGHSLKSEPKLYRKDGSRINVLEFQDFVEAQNGQHKEGKPSAAHFAPGHINAAAGVVTASTPVQAVKPAVTTGAQLTHEPAASTPLAASSPTPAATDSSAAPAPASTTVPAASPASPSMQSAAPASATAPALAAQTPAAAPAIAVPTPAGAPTTSSPASAPTGAAATVVPVAAALQGELFLVPTLNPQHGPHGQLLSIREALVIGRLLKRTVILPDIRLHSGGDGGSGVSQPQAQVYVLEDVVDLAALQAAQPVVLHRDRVGQGWNGEVDASVRVCGPNGRCGSPEGDKRAAEQQASGAAPLLRWARERLCNIAQLPAAAADLSTWRTVGVTTRRDIAGHSVTPESPDACAAASTELSHQLARSVKVRAAAFVYVHDRLGGGRFAAVHVRPHPEACMQVWRSQPFNAVDATAVCGDASLHLRLATTVHAHMAERNLTRLFVICHPDTCATVDALLISLPGVHMTAMPSHLTLELLQQYSGWRSAGALAIVEAEVAEAAELFLGTRHSPLTAAIAQGRAARGQGPGSTLMLPEGT